MKRSTAIEMLALLALVAAAIFLRSYLNNSGIDQHVFARHDEAHYVGQAIQYHQGDWTPHYFLNPTFYMLLLYGVSVVVGAVLVLTGRYASYWHFTEDLTADPYLMTMVGRYVSLSLSIGSILLLYVLARRMFNPRVAFMAAAALAADMMHSRQSVIAGNHSAVVFLVLLFFLLLHRYLQAPSATRHLLCGAILGLAVATKYHAAVMVLPLLLASVVRARRQSEKSGGLSRYFRIRYTAGFVALPIAFLLGFPSVVTDFGGFLDGLGTLSQFRQVGWTASEGSEGHAWARLFSYMARVDCGFLWAGVCGLGLIGAAWRSFVNKNWPCLLLLAAIIPLCLILGTGRAQGIRYYLIVLPFVFLLGAWALDELSNIILARVKTRKVWLTIATPALCLALLAPHALAARDFMETWYGGTDCRGELRDWTAKTLDPMTSYWELSHPRRYSPFFEESRRGKAGVQRSRWLPDLMTKTGSLAGLLNRIQASKSTSLLIVLSQRDYRLVRDLPKRMRDPGVSNCTYWSELVDALSALGPTSYFHSTDGFLHAMLYELPGR